MLNIRFIHDYYDLYGIDDDDESVNTHAHHDVSILQIGVASEIFEIEFIELEFIKRETRHAVVFILCYQRHFTINTRRTCRCIASICYDGQHQNFFFISF